MMARLPALFCLLVLITGIRGQDFDLGEAFDVDPTVETATKKDLSTTTKPVDVPKPAPTPAPKPKPKPDDGGFDLGDAIGGHDPAPTKKTQPGQPGGGGGKTFGDDDLYEGGLPPNDPHDTDRKSGRAMQPSSGGEDGQEGQEPEKQSVMAGVLSAVGVAVVGAVSSFVAYQKKKLCFKGQAEDPENVHMDNQKGDQNEPQAQTNLLPR